MGRTYGLAVALIVVVASLPLALGQSSKKASQADDVAETVSILDHIWLDAAHNYDSGTLGWLFADNFVEVHPGGAIANKQQQIDQVSNARGDSLDLHPDDIQVRYASPDVAVLTDMTTIRGHSGGIAYDGRYRVMRVFVKQRGRWRAAGAGITRISDQ